MFNSDYSVAGNVILWLNLLGVTIGFIANMYGIKHGIPALRKVHLAVAGLAFLFMAGFLHFIIFEPDYTLASSIARGVLLTSWLVVWTAPAVASAGAWRKIEKRLKADG